MGWLDTEFVLVCVAAMLSPTTLSFSILALVLGDRPLRTALWFYAGAMGATLAIGVIAAFVIGDIASSSDSAKPVWVCIVDIVAGVLIVGFIFRSLRRPPNESRKQGMIDQMSKIASSPAVAILAAGATLANPGGFIPIALKTISEEGPDAAGFIGLWVIFALASLLPLLVAIVALIVAREPAQRLLRRIQDWLMSNARLVAAVLLFALAFALLRNGIAGLLNQ